MTVGVTNSEQSLPSIAHLRDEQATTSGFLLAMLLVRTSCALLPGRCSVRRPRARSLPLLQNSVVRPLNLLVSSAAPHSPYLQSVRKFIAETRVISCAMPIYNVTSAHEFHEADCSATHPNLCLQFQTPAPSSYTMELGEIPVLLTSPGISTQITHFMLPIM